MIVQHIEVLVEEPSMEAALRCLLPKLLGQTSFEVYPHQCKNELLKRLPGRLQGYKSWLPEDWRIVVLVDRDDGDCHNLKASLERMAVDTSFPTRSATGSSRYVVLNRIAIEELEAWYFGDWQAVRAAYPSVSPHVPSQSKYRNPDAIRGGTWEAFERVLKKTGYFAGGLRKIEAARAIAPHFDPDRNTSKSFQVFRDAVREMVQE